MDWQKHGLGLTEAVKTATSAYQAEMDILAGWIADCCVVGKRYETKATDLYASYSEWCEQSGEHPEPQRRWGMRLGERGGFTRQRRMVGFFWLGIGLKSSHEPNEPNEPEKASFPREFIRASKYAESGSFGSYHSCPPAAGLSSHHPVDSTPADRNAPLPATASSDNKERF